MKKLINFQRSFIVGALLLAGQLASAQTYTWTTIAGLGGVPGAVDGVGNAARFNEPFGLAEDNVGNVLVTDYGNNLIRKLTPNGTNWAVTTILGGSTSPAQHDGAGLKSSFYSPAGITAINAGQFVEVESAAVGYASLRQIMLTNGVWAVVTIHVGTSQLGNLASGQGNGVTVDGAGEVFAAIDTDSELLTQANWITLTVPQGVNWTASTIAGTNQAGTVDGKNLAAQFNAPQGIAADAVGNVYIADTGNHTIRKLARDPITPDWITTTIAGQAGVPGFQDGTSALFNSPDGVAVDAAGNVYVSDAGNNAIRKLTLSGTKWVVTTIGGQLNRTHGTSDGVGTTASFYHPMTPMVDNLGRVFVADYNNHTIRMGVPLVGTNPPPAIQMTTAGNSAFVIWPSLVTGMVLQSTTNIALGNWQTVTTGITTNCVFSQPMTNGQTFYRLLQQ